MTTDVIRKFVEEDYKNFVIQIRLDNEHHCYCNVPNAAPIIWDWENENFMVIEPNDEIIDQSGHPMQIRLVDFGDIQELTAYVDTTTALKFINEKITDEDKKKAAKAILQKVRPALMSPRTLRQPSYDNELKVDKVTIDGE